MWQANQFLALQIQFHASHSNTITCRWHLACKGLITKETISCVGVFISYKCWKPHRGFVFPLPAVGYAKPILSSSNTLFCLDLPHFFPAKKGPFSSNEALNHFSSLKWPPSWVCASSQRVLWVRAKVNHWEPKQSFYSVCKVSDTVGLSTVVSPDIAAKEMLGVNAISGAVGIH